MAGPTNYASPSPSVVGSPSVGPAPVNAQGQGAIPFRLATLERWDVLGQNANLMTASEQIVDNILPGTGFMSEVDLYVNAPVAGNAVAAIALTEDAPYIAHSSVIISDVTGQIINLDGWSLKQIGRYGGWEPFNLEALGYVSTTGVALTATVPGYEVYTAITGGAGTATSGSFTFHLRCPFTLNKRDLVGLLGNQDRAQNYQIRTNVGASGTVYATAPTTLPTLTSIRNYGSYAVPNSVNESGVPNQVLPPTYGVISYLTRTTADAPPAPSSQVTHFLRRVGNSLRTIMLVFRAGVGATPRTVAEGAMPSNIQLKIGDQIIINEGYQTRRRKMADRYGFNAPAGVLVYDWIHDFGVQAGAELYHDWLWTENVVQAQFLITYPAGFTAGGSLSIVTSDVIVPPGVNIYMPI